MLGLTSIFAHHKTTGLAALMFATKTGFAIAVHMLMHAGANPVITNIYKETAYDFACNRVMENDDDILMLLSEQRGEERYALTRLGWIIPPIEWKRSDLAKHADQDPTSFVRHAGYLCTKGDRRKRREREEAERKKVLPRNIFLPKSEVDDEAEDF
mgnify:FL=1